MSRCALFVFVASLLMGVAALPPAAAQSAEMPASQRPFPATALRGEVRFEQPPQVLLNGQAVQLAPGARIRGTDNMVKLSGSLVGQTHVVHYTLDTYGLLHRVWLLTEAEKSRQPWPTTPAEAAAWRFNPAAQVWSKP